MQTVLTSHAVVDGVLDDFRDGLGDGAVRSRNHVYRGLNYQRMLLGLDMIPDEIALAWALHHKVRPCRDEWVETFRVADRVDVTKGLLRKELTRSQISDVVQAFPYEGFHALLLRTTARWTSTHPLRPMPMLRW